MNSIRKITGQLAEKTRGVVNPLLIRATRSSNYDIGKTLVIAGFPRSGTTWLAELAATLPQTAVLFEPLDHRTIRAAKKAGLSWNNYRDPSEAWPMGERYLRDVLSGNVLNGQTTSNIPLSRAFNVSRWIVKFVRANQMLGWLVEHFAIPPPVLIIRHPCAVFSSWVSRGWPLVDYPFPENLRFFSYYPEHKDWIRSLDSREEIFAAQWGMHHRAALDHMRGRRYHLCVYENMIVNGAEEVDAVFSHWNLHAPEGIESALRHPSAKASDTLEAGARSQLEAWVHRLDETTVRRMIDVLKRLDLDFYTAVPAPDCARLSEVAGRSV